MKKRITIGGIGSVLLGDDGVGPYVAGILEAAYCFEEGVTVADLGTPGLDLVAHLSGIDVLILVDSVKNSASPGTVTLYRKDEILRHGPAPVRMDPHSPALSESILIAEMAGEGPEEILLIGITGEQYEVNAGLSEAAEKAADEAVVQILVELGRLGVSYTKLRTKSYLPWWTPLSEAPPSPAV
ncbi:MAG TPA: hydrogenase maturation protease [Terriglobales bacterium]|nr:hydrogenase maturation protease [Terriglobales bacterium]